MNDKLHNIETALNAIRAKNFIVGSIGPSNGISFSANPVLHTSAQTARAECSRLAKTYPGKVYVFVQLAGAELVPNGTVSI